MINICFYIQYEQSGICQIIKDPREPILVYACFWSSIQQIHLYFMFFYNSCLMKSFIMIG